MTNEEIKSGVEDSKSIWALLGSVGDEAIWQAPAKVLESVLNLVAVFC